MLKKLTIALAVVAMAGSVAGAQSRIGTAVRVINKVTADQSLINTGDGVSQNQTVEVATDSLGELKLDDDTKLALGPGAKLVLDKFVYDPAKSTGSVAVNLAKGAFRFVTGAAQKKDYLIKTPSASIAVRGTVIDIYIAPNGAEWILLHEGAIEVCTANNVCRKLSNPCQAVGLPSVGKIGEPGGWVTRTGSSDIDFDVAFPFVKTPPLVDFKFYHTRAEVESNTCPNPNDPIKTQRADYGAPTAPQPVYAPSSPAPQGASVGSGSNGSANTGSQSGSTSSPVDVADLPPNAETTNLPPSTIPADDGTSAPPTGVSVYVGLQGGRGWSNNQDVPIACDDPDGIVGDGYSACGSGGILPRTATQIYEIDSQGFVGGAYAGVDLRMGMFLLGAEADFSYSDVESGAPTNANGVNLYVGGSDVSEQINWMGTVRGRAGIGFGNVLVFATGGVAFADVDYAYNLSTPIDFEHLAEASKSETKIGWTAGGGFEMSYGLWSLRTEYLYYDLGKEELQANIFSDFGSGFELTDATLSPEFETTGHIVRTGISFRLN
jgi:hypothetical protein